MDTDLGSEIGPERYLKLAVDAPLPMPLTYKTNEKWTRGDSVIVPLGRRKANAVILSDGSPPEEIKIKSITELNSLRPALNHTFLRWLEWLADYYIHPIGQVIALAFPPLLGKPTKRNSKKTSVVKPIPLSAQPNLTAEQSTCLRDILESSENFQVHLLHGVTGSGKTEVYLRLLQAALQRGKRGVVLVPEISLTPQLIQRFAGRFGDEIAVLHSHLTDRERTSQWESIVSGQKKILIGARSALFCPIADLGIVIVDEEHEPSYKQDEKLRYHARDSAIMLAKFLDIPILLGSATPSLETWHNVQSKKYRLHQMTKRVADRSLPTITVVDLRAVKVAKKDAPANDLPFWLSPRLYDDLAETLKKNEQSALFLNRRGIAQTIVCPDCGHVQTCPNCAISLTLHGRNNLVCHYCDYSTALKDVCPSCKIGEPKPMGIGTEQLENDVKKMFPKARVARADRDEIHSRETLEKLISQMETHEIDILVGTQMIAKGLDFPKLTLVGLVLADVGFNLPDFRSTERSFQLLTQMSGRAGRHLLAGGNVVIQTYNPEFPGLIYTQKADFFEFANQELKFRQELGYPPFGRLAAIKIADIQQNRAIDVAENLSRRAEKLKAQYSNYKNIVVLGPTEAPIARLRGKFRYHMLLKAPPVSHLNNFCRQLVGIGGEAWIPSGTKVQVDIDPLNLL